MVYGLELNSVTRNSDQTLVLLHGFTGSAAGWGHHMDTLADYGLRIIALDLLGHGQSDAPEDPQRYAIEHCQQDILVALQELGRKQGPGDHPWLFDGWAYSALHSIFRIFSRPYPGKRFTWIGRPC